MKEIVRIMMPSLEGLTDDVLKENKPFVIRISLPRGASFIGAASVPTVFDMVGFSGSGGPPAIAYLVAEDETEIVNRLLVLLPPGAAWEIEITTVMKPLGLIQMAGALFALLEISGSGADRMLSWFKATGAVIVDAVQYQVPELVRQLMATRAAAMRPK